MLYPKVEGQQQQIGGREASIHCFSQLSQKWRQGGGVAILGLVGEGMESCVGGEVWEDGLCEEVIQIGGGREVGKVLREEGEGKGGGMVGKVKRGGRRGGGQYIVSPSRSHSNLPHCGILIHQGPVLGIIQDDIGIVDGRFCQQPTGYCKLVSLY